MRKKLIALVFATALVGQVIGNVVGYAIWQNLPPSEAEVAFQEAVARSEAVFRLHYQANKRYCSEVSQWLATVDGIQQSN